MLELHDESEGNGWSLMNNIINNVNKSMQKKQIKIKLSLSVPSKRNEEKDKKKGGKNSKGLTYLALLINGFTYDVHDASKCSPTNRYLIQHKDPKY
jgi:hypothetical protein